MSDKYNVIFMGLKSDTPENRTKFVNILAGTHKKSPDNFSFLLEKQNVPVYSNLEKSVAEKTAVWLSNIGAVVKLDSAEIKKKPKMAYRKCKACGAFNRLEAVYCVSCKDDFRRQEKEKEEESRERRQTVDKEEVALTSNAHIRTRASNEARGIPESMNPAGIDFAIFDPSLAKEDKMEGTQPIELVPEAPLGMRPAQKPIPARTQPQPAKPVPAPAQPAPPAMPAVAKAVPVNQSSGDARIARPAQPAVPVQTAMPAVPAAPAQTPPVLQPAVKAPPTSAPPREGFMSESPSHPARQPHVKPVTNENPAPPSSSRGDGGFMAKPLPQTSKGSSSDKGTPKGIKNMIILMGLVLPILTMIALGENSATDIPAGFGGFKKVLETENMLFVVTIVFSLICAFLLWKRVKNAHLVTIGFFVFYVAFLIYDYQMLLNLPKPALISTKLWEMVMDEARSKFHLYLIVRLGISIPITAYLLKSEIIKKEFT